MAVPVGERDQSKLEAHGLRAEGTARVAYKGWRAHAEKGDNPRLLEKSDE